MNRDRSRDELELDAAGRWLEAARRVPSPNFDTRPAGVEVDLVVIHGISLPPGEFGTGCVERLFCNALDPSEHPYFRSIADLKLSSHLFIDRAGAITQFVALDARAWHAGASRHAGRERCNDFSIGIELEGTDEQVYDPRQYASLARVLRCLFRRFPALGPQRVVGHCDIAPGRKTDPGPAFDWRQLHALLAAPRSDHGSAAC